MRLLLLLSLLVLVVAVYTHPVATVWPDIFHALLIQSRKNVTSVVDLYYDYKNGVNLHVIQAQNGSDALFDHELESGVTYYYRMKFVEEGKWEYVTDVPCRVNHGRYGIVEPDFLQDAEFVAEDDTSYQFQKVMMPNGKYFITYWEDKFSRKPLRWEFFDDAKFQVIQWHPDVQQHFQVPEQCLLKQNDKTQTQ